MANNNRHSYIEFYMSDWIGGTAILSPLQEWVLLQISLYNWDKYENVPEKKLEALLGRHPGWKEDLEYLIEIVEKVVRTRGGGLFNPRAMASAKKAYDLWEKKSKGGKTTAKKTKKPVKKQQPAKESGSSPGANENENENENEIDSKLSTGAGENGDLIFSVDPEVWAEWVEYRERIKKPMSERTENRILKELEEFHGYGHDPTEILHRSIDNGWTGIFKPKGGGRNGNGNSDGFGNALNEAGGR